MYEYACNYWANWFPKLGSYQNFTYRMNRLSDCVALLTDLLMAELDEACSSETVLIDSFPITTCSARRRPKVARQMIGKGYCAAKKLYYYGCKLHLLSGFRAKKMPLPRQVGYTPANVHDLTALRPVLKELQNITVIADKAYGDKELREHLMNRNSSLLTPPKKNKAEPELLSRFDKAADELLARAISSIRQPIESLVNWLQEKVNIQNASKVRSQKGLNLHIFGKVAAALVAFIFV